jgi:hypothetical protein
MGRSYDGYPGDPHHADGRGIRSCVAWLERALEALQAMYTHLYYIMEGNRTVATENILRRLCRSACQRD